MVVFKVRGELFHTSSAKNSHYVMEQEGSTPALGNPKSNFFPQMKESEAKWVDVHLVH